MRIKPALGACLLAIAAIAGIAACTPAAPDPQPTVNASPGPVSGGSIAANGYSYGSGTYYVATRRKVPPNWGDAKAWYDFAQRDGYSVGDTPKKGAIAWTDRGPIGQVAIVEAANADGTVTISEMNGEGGWNRVTTRTAPAATFKYIY